MIIDGDNDNIYMIVNSVWCICGFGVIGILIGDIICYSAWSYEDIIMLIVTTWI